MLVLVSALVLVAGTLGGMRWWGDRALEQLTPVSDLRWDGYVIEYEWHEGRPPAAWDRDRHHLRVLRGESLVLDQDYPVTVDLFDAGPGGFLAALNIDDDAELELMLCEDGVIETVIEPDRSTGVLSTHSGSGWSASRARELCAAVGLAGSRPNAGCATCSIIPIALPAFIAILIAARRERREEEREGRSTF